VAFTVCRLGGYILWVGRARELPSRSSRSGAHFNPAVTIGLAVARRFEWRDAPAYIATQVVAGLVAGGLLEVIASGKPGFVATGNMAANGYGAHSPGGYGLGAAIAGATYAVITGVHREDRDVSGDVSAA